LLVADDGRLAMIRCVGPTAIGVKEQRIELHRPRHLTIRRHVSQLVKWWYTGEANRTGNELVWPDGTKLTVTRGEISGVDPQGFTETMVHFGGMKFADPHPFIYPVVTARPDSGVLEITVTVGRK
jgi:hypothetical protein